MASGQLGSLLRHIRRIIGATPAADVADGLLLEQFRLHRDEAAFTSLVQRHGPLVLGACRRVLHDPHDVEDAFQATFLVLAKRAAAIRRPEALSSWLYGVAYRVAARARSQGQQRRAHEQQGTAMSAADSSGRNDKQNTEPTAPQLDPPSAAVHRELRSVLDEELNRLPEKYRLPMVLCYLEGKTNEEAAAQLHWTKGTVSGRLARARDLLRNRLTRRGLVLSACVLDAALSATAVTAAVPATLVDSTVKGACWFTAGKAVAAGVGSAHAVALAQGALHAMSWARLKVVAAALVVVGLSGSAAGVLAYQTWIGSAVPATVAGPSAVASKHSGPTEVVPANVDPARFAQAAVVLRVKRHGQPTVAPKHRWDDLVIVEVLKNTSGHSFGKTLMVASLATKHGVPAETCTVYLEALHPADPHDHHWKLLNDGAPEGVSHVALPEKHAPGH